jgi:hypothetical protein
VQADKVDARVLAEIARRDVGARAVDPVASMTTLLERLR